MATTFQIFCPKEQADMDHVASRDLNGEWLFHCESCNHFLKLPREINPADFPVFFDVHRERNAGQIVLVEHPEINSAQNQNQNQ